MVFPAGKEELKNDLSQMRNMSLDKGFERLFNGKDFTGFEMSLAMGGNESTYTFDDAARARARKPAGQWNSVEIVFKDGQLWTYLNGALITHVTKHPFTEAGYIGFQVESGPVYWRNIRIRAD